MYLRLHETRDPGTDPCVWSLPISAKTGSQHELPIKENATQGGQLSWLVAKQYIEAWAKWPSVHWRQFGRSYKLVAEPFMTLFIRLWTGSELTWYRKPLPEPMMTYQMFGTRNDFLKITTAENWQIGSEVSEYKEVIFKPTRNWFLAFIQI